MWWSDLSLLGFIVSLISLFSACFIGVLQIIIPHIDKKSTDKKQMRDMTLRICESFQRNVYPEFVELLKVYGRHKNVIDNISFDNITGIISKPIEINPDINVFLDRIMFLFNEMDSFAAYILDKTMTDETIAFSLQGKAFCDIIDSFKKIYELYIYVDPIGYVSLDELYNKWSSCDNIKY